MLALCMLVASPGVQLQQPKFWLQVQWLLDTPVHFLKSRASMSSAHDGWCDTHMVVLPPYRAPLLFMVCPLQQGAGVRPVVSIWGGLRPALDTCHISKIKDR